MADNTKYAGVIESFDFDATYNWLIEHGGLFSVGTRAYIESDEGKAERAKTIQFNQESASTVAAVQVAYTGKTTAERTACLKERLSKLRKMGYFAGKLLFYHQKNLLSFDNLPICSHQ